MAWQKAIEDKFGQTWGYWEIDTVLFDIDKATVTVYYKGYVSAAAKAAGKLSTSDKFTFPAGEAPELSASVLTYLQAKARALPKFSGSQDA